MHPHGHNIYHGPVVINWHARPQLSPSDRNRTYKYHGPVTINYVGHGTFDANIPGRHVYKESVTVNWTAASRVGARDDDPLVKLEYHKDIKYHRLVEGMPVPTAVALLGDAHVTAAVVVLPGQDWLAVQDGLGYRCVRDR
jgi:hypothetical protein